ncbi:MAG: DNA-directed RNA polymerase subunit B'', partial [Candidatus Heimdallarchaeaceae archaeon]
MAKKKSSSNTNSRWVLVNAMFDELGLVRQHLDSFNEFLEKRLQSVIKEIKTIEPEDSEFYVRLDKVEVEEPTIREADGSQSSVYPMEARIRNLTYASRLNLHMTPIRKGSDDSVEVPLEPISVFIGYLPIMLKSNKCQLFNRSPESLIKLGEDPRDPGGYFLVNGSERVIVTQEDLAPNRILIDKLKSKGNVTSEAKVFSVIHGFRAPVTVEHTNDGQLRVSFPSMPRKISLILLMRALGIERDDMIAMAISPTPELRSRVMSILMRESSEIDTTEESLDYIGKRVAVGQTKEYRINRAMQVLDKYLLPHLGSDEESRLKKAFFLARMAQRLLELEAGARHKDDKDHYANKRLKLAGDLLLMLYRVAFHALCRDIKYQLERVTVRGRKPNLKTAVRADLITERLRHALAT